VIAVRFALVYLVTAILDYTAFWLALKAGAAILVAQIAGRAASVPFNYLAVRSRVFGSQVPHEVAGPKFILLYTAAFFASWGLIEWWKDLIPLRTPEYRVVVAKMLAEGGILTIKFFVQKYLIFHQKG
jgi:putative flippase GtrA